MQGRALDPPDPGSPGSVRARRLWPWILLGVVVFGIVLGAFGLRLSNYVISRPGPVRNVENLVEVRGAKTYPSRGSLSLTTVSFVPRPTLARLLLAYLDPHETVLNAHDLITTGSFNQLLSQEKLEMTQSKRDAVQTALDALGYKKATGDGARVVYVQRGTPAADSLQVGDVVRSIDGEKVSTSCGVPEGLGSKKPGDRVRFSIERHNRRRRVVIKTIDNPNEPGQQAFVGVGMTTYHFAYHPGVNVHVKTGGIGGPSAGTMMALTIYDRLTPGDLTGGHTIAGTGTIDPCTGDVGPIGGIREKVAAAGDQGVQTFLAPAADAPAARSTDHGDMKIVTIHTFHQAVRYLESATR